jgi:ABC-2 type transport system ATP-binding protein
MSVPQTYAVRERESGAQAALESLFRRARTEIHAVDGISFALAPGEIVDFLGPNGAGKTTTLKMLSGLLHPTAGELAVLDRAPWKREQDFLRQITLVIGQRNQLVWDIPAAALLHKPRVVFLDEPTIGLDVTMQRRIRAFIAEYNRRYGAAVLLTSHYMADVEALCRRVVIIHHGRLLFDGDLSNLVQRFTAYKTIVVRLGECDSDLSGYGEVMSCADGAFTLRVPKGETARVTSRLLADLPVIDLTVEDPPIEEVIERVFAQGAA